MTTAGSYGICELSEPPPPPLLLEVEDSELDRILEEELGVAIPYCHFWILGFRGSSDTMRKYMRNCILCQFVIGWFFSLTLHVFNYRLK